MKKAGFVRAEENDRCPFDDAFKYQEGMILTKVKVWTGVAVDAVQFIYGDKELEKHGGPGGGCKEGTLDAGDYIKSVRIGTGEFGGRQVLTSAAFYNQKGKKIAGNEPPQSAIELKAGEGECICGLYGETVKAGKTEILSEIGIYTNKLPDIGTIIDSIPDAFGKLL